MKVKTFLSFVCTFFCHNICHVIIIISNNIVAVTRDVSSKCRGLCFKIVVNLSLIKQSFLKWWWCSRCNFMDGKTFSYVVFCDCFHFHVLFVFKRIISQILFVPSILYFSLRLAKIYIWCVVLFGGSLLGLIVTMTVLPRWVNQHFRVWRLTWTILKLKVKLFFSFESARRS